MDKFAKTGFRRILKRIQRLRRALALLEIGPSGNDRRNRDYVTREIWLERIDDLKVAYVDLQLAVKP